MLDALKFVQGAVAKKDFVPELTHFHINNGMIQSYNGEIALSAPIDLDLSVVPKAVPLVKAIQTCESVVKMHLTDSNRLSIQSGNFRVLIDCLPIETYPNIYPEGTKVPIDFDLVAVLSTLLPFVAEDASRPWARGILLANQSAYATNNIIVLEHWLDVPIPEPVNIPKAALQEIVRIGQNPKYLQVSPTTVSFIYEDNKWLRSQLYTAQWPDTLQDMLPMPKDYNLSEIEEDFFPSIATLLPFVDPTLKVVHFNGEHASTDRDPEIGASVKIPNAPPCGKYNINQLCLLEQVATHIDWTPYPKPAVFFGESIRGMIIGLRDYAG